MSKKEKKVYVPEMVDKKEYSKQVRKNIIISIVIILALIGSFIGGIVYEKNDQVRVNKEAAKLIKSLK